ncbi:MAG: M56 family metallopeptidase, partial [Polyangiaceae bacterium]
MIARFGHDLAAWLLPVNAWTLALLLGALVLDRALQHRALASLRIALYAPVVLRVLVPFSWSVPVACLPRLAIVLPADTFSRTSATAASPGASEYVVLAVAYGIVALLIAGLSVARRWRLARALRGSKTLQLPGPAYPVTTHPELGPMVAGLWNPRIVLPEGLANGGDPAALACVLDHEAAHIRRGDPWLSAALDVLLALAWPVAPLWIAAARVRNLVELACDEAALEDADAAGRLRYGHLLLDLAERLPHLHPGPAALYFGSKLRARVEAIAHRSHWATSVQWALVACAVVAFAACSSA